MSYGEDNACNHKWIAFTADENICKNCGAKDWMVEGGIKNHDNETATLRDQFAMAALNGLIECQIQRIPLDDIAGTMATSAYDFADAMLEARKK